MFVSGLFLTLLFFAVSSVPFDYTNEALLDQVTELPGLNWQPKFNQFSGYINLVFKSLVVSVSRPCSGEATRKCVILSQIDLATK